MLKDLEAFIYRHKLLEPDDVVIIGYSGGADSACLMHLMVELGYTVTAAHLHHGMRKEAEEEAEKCREVAESLRIGFLLGRADVPALAKAGKMSLEEAGRHARYEFFKQCTESVPHGVVATAHALNDNAETMLINLARGTGMSGLGGIPVQRGSIVRPLLWATRDQTRNFCIERGIWFHDDPANSDMANARTAIRRNAIPAMEEVNKNALGNIARAAELMQSENKLLDSMAAAMLEACERKCEHPLAFLTESVEVAFDKYKLRHYPLPLQRRGIRLAGLSLGAAFQFDHIEACLSALESSSFSVTAEGGSVVAEVDGDLLRLRSISAVEPFRELLTIPGETICDEMNWSLAAWEEGGYELKSPLEGKLDSGKVRGQLFARQVLPGDRIELPGHKPAKVNDLLTEQKVKASAKVRTPVVCDMVGIVWVPMLGTEARVACVEPKTRCLALRFGPISSD